MGRVAAISTRRLPRVSALRRPGAAPTLACALAALAAYAIFASGATGQPAEARLQIALAVTGVAALGALAIGRLRFSAAPRALAGIGLLAAFSAWCGLSIAWSITPDLSWGWLNRAAAYVLVTALAVLAVHLGHAREVAFAKIGRDR